MPLVMCRACKQKFDRAKLKQGDDWVMPSKNFYYHTKCYENWRNDKNNVAAKKKDEEWISYIYDFLSRDLKVLYDYRKCESQRQNFIKSKNYTNKGIFFALKYYYEIQHQSWEKSKEGIGIVPYIYSESCHYWEEQHIKGSNILSMIEKQMQDRKERTTLTINKKKKERIHKPNWGEIEAITDE